MLLPINNSLCCSGLLQWAEIEDINKCLIKRQRELLYIQRQFSALILILTAVNCKLTNYQRLFNKVY